MTPKECGQYVNNLIANAEISAAIDNLVSFFQGKSEFGALRSQVLYIKSRYQKTKTEEERGLISFDNAQLSYNQITNQLLGIAAQLESGNYESDGGIGGSSTVRRWGLLLGLPLFVLLAWLVYLFFIEPGIKQKTTQATFVCPTFEETYPFRILVLPFQSVDGSEITTTHDQIRRRFKFLSDSIQLMADVQSVEDEFAVDNPLYPESFSEAEQLVSGCTPQPELVIWGSSEKNPNQELTLLTQFKFINLGERFELGKIKNPEGTSVESTPILTSIATGNSVTGRIEEILLGVFAYLKGDVDGAIALLSKAESTDPESALIKGTFLADALIKKEQYDDAIVAYDSVLEVHPNYGLALNNLAMLQYKKGDYLESVEKFSKHLELDPSDVNAWVNRGNAYMKSDMYKLAESDYTTAMEAAPDNEEAQKHLEDIKKAIQEEERKLKAAQSQLNKRSSQNNISTYRTIAQSAFKLGQYDLSIQSAERVRQLEPKNEEAIQIISQSYWAKGDSIGLDRFLNQTLKADAVIIDRSKLLPKRINKMVNPESN